MNGATDLRDELRAAAVAYADLGWRVVPVEPRGKRPTDGLAWQTPAYRRSAAQLLAHWQRPYNIGVLLGPESGDLVDVDLDCLEARVLAAMCLPPGPFVFGRASALRSHYLYIAPSAHLIQLRDLPVGGLPGQMLVELRAKPAGGAGAQTVLPPSVHKTGERIEWDADAGDSSELPAKVDAAELTAAVRRLAVAAFLARHLGGVDAALRYLAEPREGLLKPDVAAHARELAGLPRQRIQQRTRPQEWPGRSGGPFERLRAAGVEAAAALFGLEWDEQRRALVICPACRAETRSSHDRRPAAGVLVAANSGRELWTHGKCGQTGDAVSLAAAVLLGTLKPSSSNEWSRLATALRERGWE